MSNFPHGIDSDSAKILADAAQNVALTRGCTYDEARRIVRDDLDRGAGARFLPAAAVQRINYQREHVASARAKFMASLDGLKKWAEENGLAGQVSEMVGEWQRTILMPGEFGGLPRLTSTPEETQARHDATAAKAEADYRKGMAANPGVYAHGQGK